MKSQAAYWKGEYEAAQAKLDEIRPLVLGRLARHPDDTFRQIRDVLDGPWCTGVPYRESEGCHDPECPLHKGKPEGYSGRTAVHATGGTDFVVPDEHDDHEPLEGDATVEVPCSWPVSEEGAEPEPDPLDMADPGDRF